MPTPNLSTDTREDLLNYLQALLATVVTGTGATLATFTFPDGSTGPACFRDRDALKAETNLPAIIVMDGKTTLVTEVGPNDGQQMPAAVYRLLPQIFVQLRPRYDDTNLTIDDGNGNIVSAPIGPELSAWRLAIIKLLQSDINLFARLGTNGRVRFMGDETDMQAGAPMVGQLRLDFAFDFAMDPYRL